MRLRTVPVTFADAKAFVADWHRHHRPPVGHKYSIGVANDDDVLVGVAVVGRPVARLLDDGLTLPPGDHRRLTQCVQPPVRRGLAGRQGAGLPPAHYLYPEGRSLAGPSC